jgi:4-amino-4-deoxy-L-arabinose transferase-like glycosyltransferase
VSPRLTRIVIAAVAIAHAALFIVYQRPDWDTQWTDQNGYLMLGRNLAETGRYTRFAATQDYVPEAIRTPMYPAFVALLDLVFGQSRVVIASAQAVLFAIICVLVYEIARAATTELIALAAGLATALYPPLPYFGALVLTEVFTTCLVTAGLAVWLAALRKDSTALFVASGVIFGATALTRPAFEYLPLFLIPAAVFAAREHRRRRWRGGAIMLVTFCAVVAPWMAYNAVYFKTLTFTPAGGPGRQLFEGTWQVELPGRVEAELTTLADAHLDRTVLDDKVREVAARTQLPAETLLRYVHQHQDIRKIWIEPVDPWQRMLSRIEADHEYFRVGVENIREHPVRHLWRRATRGTFLLWAAEIPVRYSDINRMSPLTIRAIWLLQVALIVVAAVGFILLVQQGAVTEGFAMAALILYVSAVHVPLYSEARYSLPAKPIVLLFAAAAVMIAAERWNERNTRRAGYRPLSHRT